MFLLSRTQIQTPLATSCDVALAPDATRGKQRLVSDCKVSRFHTVFSVLDRSGVSGYCEAAEIAKRL